VFATGPGRDPLHPGAGKWVSEAGLRLTQEISFVLTPQGLLHSVRTVKSSGYSDVDSAVLDAVRGWKFKPAPASAGNVQGTVSYLIVPRESGPPAGILAGQELGRGTASGSARPA
jgi:TonB family protein